MLAKYFNYAIHSTIIVMFFKKTSFLSQYYQKNHMFDSRQTIETKLFTTRPDCPKLKGQQPTKQLGSEFSDTSLPETQPFYQHNNKFTSYTTYTAHIILRNAYGITWVIDAGVEDEQKNKSIVQVISCIFLS